MQKSDQDSDHLEVTNFVKDGKHHPPFEHYPRLYPRHVYEHDIIKDLEKSGLWGRIPEETEGKIHEYLTEDGCNMFQHEIINLLEKEGLFNA